MGTLSCLIPVHNGAKYITECLASVSIQKVKFNQIIIVDDGSTDNTASLISMLSKSLNIDIEYHYTPKQKTISDVRNKLLELNKCEYISFLDADDVWHPNKTIIQKTFLDDNKGSTVVIGKLIQFKGDLKNISKLKVKEPQKNFLLQSAMIRKSCFDLVGGFDTNITCGEDIEWYYRYVKKSLIDINHLEDIVLFYRRHLDNITNDSQMRKKNLDKLLSIINT